MTAVWGSIVVVLAVASVSAARSEGGGRWVTAATWLALAAGFAFLQWGDSGLAASAAVAAMAGLVVVRGTTQDRTRRVRMAAFASIVPAALGVCAIVCVLDATTQWGAHLVLFTAAWGALVASLSSLFASMGSSRSPTSVGVAIAGVATAVLAAGTGRSSLPAAFYGVPLRAGDEPLRWIMGPVPKFDGGIVLSVAVPVPVIEYALIALVCVGLLVAGLAVTGRTRAAGNVLGVGLLASGAMLGGLKSLVGSLRMPSSSIYADEVKRMLLARGGGRVVDAGTFSGEQDLSVAMADVAPEIFGFLVIALLCLVGVIAVRRESEPAPQIDSGFARDYQALGVSFLWVSWFVLMIIHDGFVGSPGLGAPGEWVFTGVLLASTGLVVATWTEGKGRFAQVIGDLTPGLIVAGLFITAGLAWRFGALPGLSLGVF